MRTTGGVLQMDAEGPVNGSVVVGLTADTGGWLSYCGEQGPDPGGDPVPFERLQVDDLASLVERLLSGLEHAHDAQAGVAVVDRSFVAQNAVGEVVELDLQSL
jgi:hypothetical protein